MQHFYGYAQGVKYGKRKHNEYHQWAQSYAEACVARTKGDELARQCATASQAWADSVWTKLNRQIQSSGLPMGKQPSQ